MAIYTNKITKYLLVAVFEQQGWILFAVVTSARCSDAGSHVDKGRHDLQMNKP
jgi:hypothetical protein